MSNGLAVMNEINPRDFLRLECLIIEVVPDPTHRLSRNVDCVQPAAAFGSCSLLLPGRGVGSPRRDAPVRWIPPAGRPDSRLPAVKGPAVALAR